MLPFIAILGRLQLNRILRQLNVIQSRGLHTLSVVRVGPQRSSEDTAPLQVATLSRYLDGGR